MSNVTYPLLNPLINPPVDINSSDDENSDAGSYESGVSDDELSEVEFADIMDPETPPGPPPTEERLRARPRRRRRLFR